MTELYFDATKKSLEVMERKEYRDPIDVHDVSKKTIVDQLEKDILGMRWDGRQVKNRMKLEKEYFELTGKYCKKLSAAKKIVNQPQKLYETHKLPTTSIHCWHCGSTVCGLAPKKCRAKELVRGIKEADESWFQDEVTIRKFANLWPSVKHGDIDRFTA